MAITYQIVTNFKTRYADQIADIMIREWGFNYITGFGYKSIAEYKLWKDDSIFMIALSENQKQVIGMIAFERYSMAGNFRFTPCICCLYVSPEYRNAGIGDALLASMCSYLREHFALRELYAWVLSRDIGFWFELRGWRYVTEWIYLDRRVYIMRSSLVY